MHVTVNVGYCPIIDDSQDVYWLKNEITYIVAEWSQILKELDFIQSQSLNTTHCTSWHHVKDTVCYVV